MPAAVVGPLACLGSPTNVILCAAVTAFVNSSTRYPPGIFAGVLVPNVIESPNGRIRHALPLAGQGRKSPASTLGLPPAPAALPSRFVPPAPVASTRDPPEPASG